MAELKTKPTRRSAKAYVRSIEHEGRRADSEILLKLFIDTTHEKPVMWGESIVGFGRYRYQNSQGHAEWFLTGFAPRKQNLVVYIMPGFAEYPALMRKLGKHKIGRSCLYINRLADVDIEILRGLVDQSASWMRAKYDCR